MSAGAAATESIVASISPMSPISTDAIEKKSLCDQICRYFVRGNCRFGEYCYFSHDLSNLGAAKPGNVSLKLNNDDDVKPSTSRKTNNWVNAPIFVPKRIKDEIQMDDETEMENEEGAAALPVATCSYANAVGNADAGLTTRNMQHMSLDYATNPNGVSYGPVPHLTNQLCPYMPPCPYMHNCAFGLHMQLCEMCDQYVLDPTDANQRRKHNHECLEQHEKDMELSFAIARSKDKTCGICFETIIEKSGREKRFGILSNCNHIFCLECIRKWRQAKQFEHKITRSCPECRVASDFVCPSAFWVDTKEDKTKLLDAYRKALGAKDCKYFKKVITL